jgi:3-oxoacyl-[acyl-carrier protein] reductase
MTLDVSGKIALVTGASRGIGRECSKLLAKSGAEVIVNYNKSKEEAEKVLNEISHDLGKSEIVQADIAKPEDVQALFEYIRKKFKQLDILVNNAGIIKDKLLLNMELSDWDTVHDTNLRGVFLCTKYAVELMLPRHYGKIINISSISAIRGGRGQTNYASSKGALISFTRSCAVELSGKGLQVNAVLPGMIVTDMSKRVRKLAGEDILKSIPAARFGEPLDVAHLVLFLASDNAAYITGQAISVDGGLSIS